MRRISEAVAESFGVRQVYGESIERDGALVIPAARVWSSGGAGGGMGAAAEPASREDRAGGSAEPDTKAPVDGGGGGIGFGRHAEPAGAFVVDDHGVRWVPAVNVNRIVFGGQAAFALAAVAVGWAVARRRRG